MHKKLSYRYQLGYNTKKGVTRVIDWGFLSDYFTPGGYYMTNATWKPLLMLSLVPILMFLAQAWFWFILQVIANIGYAYYIYWTLLNYLNPETNVLFYSSIYLLYIVSLIVIGLRWKKSRGRKS